MTTGESQELRTLLVRAAAGDQDCWGQLLLQHGDRLRRLIAVRLDPRLQVRIDPEDVLQKVYLAASTSLGEYVRRPSIPFYLWLRAITLKTLLMAHRRHRDTEMRAVGREVPLDLVPDRQLTTAQRSGTGHSPDAVAEQAEQRERLHAALDRLRPLDREVLVLRHLEQLTRNEIAQVLHITEAAAGKRYLRALQRLKDVWGQLPGGREAPGS